MTTAKVWTWGWLVAACLVIIGCGGGSKGPVPDVPIAETKAPLGNVRLLVTVDKPDGSGSNIDAYVDEWFDGFKKAFRAAALRAGFRVVEGGEHDLKVTLSGEGFDVRHDAIDKRATVRAKLTSGGKSHELIGEVSYNLSEEEFEVPGDHPKWMLKANSHEWFAHHLLNDVLKQDRVIAFVKGQDGAGAIASSGGGTTGGSSSGGKGSPKGFVTGAPQRNAYALVIGVEKYRDVKTPATGATNDAKTFAKLAKSTMGLPAKNVRLAVGNRATKGDIEKHVDWLVANVPKGGRIYLFFSGHGAPDGAEGTPYLLPYDGDPAALDRTALPLQKILDRLQNSAAEDAVAFVDTCFSGAGGRSVLPDGARPLVRVKKPAAKAKVALLSASSGEQISGPSADKKNGAFTRFVTVGIGRGEADADGDGQITVAELAEWVKPRVEREARKQGRDQSPQLSSPTGARPTDMVVAHGVQ